MSGFQGHGNRKKNPQHCQEDQNQPHPAKDRADVGHRTRWHRGEKQKH
jgi:hypothetical protein